MHEAQVQPPVRELDPTNLNYEYTCHTKDLAGYNEDQRYHVLQITPVTAKQINTWFFVFFFLKERGNEVLVSGRLWRGCLNFFIPTASHRWAW